MEFLGLIIPFIAAGGWLWWIYRTDRYKREPRRLVFKTFGLGAAGGIAGLVGLFLLVMLLPEGIDLSVMQLVLVPIHVAALAGVLYFVPFRTPHWSEPFDGVVFGGAAGIGYGLTYTLFVLLDSPLLGFRAAVFSIPTYMLAGLIIGHYMSRARFGRHKRARSAWVRGLSITALYLVGFGLAEALGGEVLGRSNPLASVVAYATNTFGWVLALWAMDQSTRESRYDPANYRFWLAPTPCPHCGSGYPVGAAYCNHCGRPIDGRKGA